MIHDMKWCLVAKMMWFTNYVTDIYFSVTAVFFEDWIKALNMEQSGGYLNYSLPLISRTKFNERQSIFISCDSDKISFCIKRQTGMKGLIAAEIKEDIITPHYRKDWGCLR